MFPKKSDIYARFLNLSRAVEQLNFADLDVDLKALIELVADRAVRNEPDYTVSELIGMTILGSPATVHARIKKCVSLGYLELLSNSQDGRVRHIKLAPRAIEYFEKLNQSLISVLK